MRTPSKMGREPALKKNRKSAGKQRVFTHGQKQPGDYGEIVEIPLINLHPSPENGTIYVPIENDEPEMAKLAANVGAIGITNALLVTADFFIISGHRRWQAAGIAGLPTVPCRVHRLSRAKIPGFTALLRGENLQREKTRDERLREAVIDTDPNAAQAALSDYRAKASLLDVDEVELRAPKARQPIPGAQAGFLSATQAAIESLREFLPVSVRALHYRLLNDPPLMRASKRGSRYQNNAKSYKALTVLVTAARHSGEIPYEVIADPTRPVTLWDVCRGTGGYLARELKKLFLGYARDLLQSQANHIEIVGEKNTVEGIIRPVAMKYCIPLTIGRGYCSTRPKYDIAQRFRKSGKKKLVLLALTDRDPDGNEIAHNIARSLRDDFGIQDIVPVRVALTAAQVAAEGLPASFLKAKPGSMSYQRFLDSNGGSDAVHELEALPPDALQRLLDDAIRAVLDADAFNFECEEEKKDAVHLAAKRRVALDALGGGEGEL